MIGTALLAVAVVAELGQRTGPPLVVTAAHVVEHQRALGQVPPGKLSLRWTVAASTASPRRRTIRPRRHRPRATSSASVVVCQSRVVASFEQGKRIRCTIMANTKSRSRQGLEAISVSRPSLRIIRSTASTCPWGKERSVRKASLVETKVSPLRLRRIRVDDCFGQMREVAQGLVEDLLALAIASPQQVGLVDLAVVAADDLWLHEQNHFWMPCV